MNIVIPVAVWVVIVLLQYARDLLLVVVSAFQHFQAVGSEQPGIDPHDVLVVGQAEYGVSENGTEAQVLSGPTLHLQHSHLQYRYPLQSIQSRSTSHTIYRIGWRSHIDDYSRFWSMLSYKYKQFINSHKFLAKKVSVCDLAFELKQQRFTPQQLREVALFVFRQAPKYAYIIFHKLVTEIFPNCLYEGEQSRQIEEEMHYGLVALFIMKESTFGQQDFQVFRGRALQAFITVFDRNFPLTPKNILLRAYFQFYQGEFSEALELAKNLAEVLRSDQQFVKWGSHLLIAQIYFARRLYEKCIQELKICFKMNNDLPSKARVAMAHCYFHLGKYQMAEAIFKRILKVDSRCIEAVIGLAVICQRNEEYQNYFYCLKIASKKHPLILLHLAEHFLIINQLEEARDFAEKGLKAIKRISRIHQFKEAIRDDYFEYEGRFWNIIGQTYHMQGKYKKALKWYNLLSRKDISCNLWNKVQQAQCLVALCQYSEASRIMEALYQQYHDHFAKIYKETKVLGDTWRLMAYLKTKLKEVKSQPKKTYSYFLQSFKFDKTNPFIRLQLSLFYTLQMEHKKALVQFKNGVDMMTAQSVDICAQIYNNLAVLYLENDEVDNAELMLQQAGSKLEGDDQLSEADRIAMETVIVYNRGIVAEEKNLVETAIQIYRQALQTNKFFLYAYLRLAYCLWRQGARQQSYQVINEAVQTCTVCKKEYKGMDPDSLHLLKAYLRMEADEFDSSRESIGVVKNQDNYTKLLKICLAYNSMVSNEKKHHQLDLFKNLASELQVMVEEDPQNIFAVAGLLTVRLAMQGMNFSGEPLKEYQVYDAFGQLKSHIHKKYLPQLDYNTALFSIRVNNMGSAVSLLKELRKNNLKQINSLYAYCLLSTKQMAMAYKIAKINVLLYPADPVVRYQLQFITLKKCQEKVESLSATSREDELLRQTNQVRYCCRFFKFGALLDLDQYQHQKHNFCAIQKLKCFCKQLTNSALACDLKYQSLWEQMKKLSPLKRQNSVISEDNHLRKRYKHNQQFL